MDNRIGNRTNHPHKILVCEFNGDMGVDLAISIANNRIVNSRIFIDAFIDRKVLTNKKECATITLRFQQKKKEKEIKLIRGGHNEN